MIESALEIDRGPFVRPRMSAAWWTLVGVSIPADFLMLPIVSAIDTPPTPPAAVLAFGMLGSTLAQGSLLAAWLVWGDGPFLRRLFWHWMIAGGLCCLWLIGLAMAAPPRDFREVGFTVALTVPIVTLGAQLPLWIVRLLFGWRLARIGEPHVAEQPLSIRDLLLATLIVAASFAVARLSPAAFQEPEFRFAWGIFMTVAAAFSALAILPAAAILLRPRPFERAVAYGLAYACWPVVLLWGSIVIIRIYGLTSLGPWAIYVGMTSLVFSYAGTAILASAAARECGYLLNWGRTPASPAEPIQTSKVVWDVT